MATTMLHIGTSFKVGDKVQVNGALAQGDGVVEQIRYFNPFGPLPEKNADEAFPHLVVRAAQTGKLIRYNALDLLAGKVKPTNGNGSLGIMENMITATHMATENAFSQKPLYCNVGDEVFLDGDLYIGLGTVEGIETVGNKATADKPYPHYLIRGLNGKLYRYHADEVSAKITTDAEVFPVVETMLCEHFDVDSYNINDNELINQPVAMFVENPSGCTMKLKDGRTLTYILPSYHLS